MKSYLLPTLVVIAVFLLVCLPAAHADPVKVGDKAPEATGITDSGASLNLADVYKKHTYTLVYFYPKADTPGCTKEGCSLRDAYATLTDKGVAVIGVSFDTVEAQKAFKDKYQFPFTLLADPKGEVVKAFGVPSRSMGSGSFANRQSFLVKDGKIVWADYKASTDKQAADVLKVVEEMKG